MDMDIMWESKHDYEIIDEKNEWNCRFFKNKFLRDLSTKIPRKQNFTKIKNYKKY